MRSEATEVDHGEGVRVQEIADAPDRGMLKAASMCKECSRHVQVMPKACITFVQGQSEDCTLQARMGSIDLGHGDGFVSFCFLTRFDVIPYVRPMQTIRRVCLLFPPLNALGFLSARTLSLFLGDTHTRFKSMLSGEIVTNITTTV